VTVGVRRIASLVLGARDAPGRILGVKVEREPLDLGAEPALQPLGPRKADAAEGSDVVAPDEEVHETSLPDAHEA
jgi:hypothetical protein